VRSPPLIASNSLVTGSSATHTQWGERDKQLSASSSLTSLAFTALSKAKSSSNCTCVTCTSWRKEREKAAAWSATSISQCSTVFGSTVKTRATARIPSPSANAPTAHTSTSGATRLPCNGVPWVSRKYCLQLRHWNWRHRPPLGYPLARIFSSPTQP
jgi:hypothetical protein